MKKSWQERARFWLLFFIVFVASFSLALSEDESEPEDIPVRTIDRGKTTPGRNAPQHQHPSPSLSSSSHSRRRRQAFDGFRFSDLFRIFNSGALEGVDSMLRSTRNFDVFQCLERLSCEMAAPLRNVGTSEAPEVIDDTAAELEDPTLLAAQQPFAQQGFPQFPQVPQFFQPGLPQVQQFVQPALQYFPQPGFQPFAPQIPQQFAPQIPQLAYPQYVQAGGQFIQPAAQFLHPQYVYPPGLLQQLSIQGNHAVQGAATPDAHEASPAIPAATGHAAAHGAEHAGEHNAGGAVMRSAEEHGNEEPHATQREAFADDNYQTPWERVSNRHFFHGYRDRIRRRQEKRNWFGRMFRNLKNEYYRRNRRGKRDVSNSAKKSKTLSRKKRGIVDTLKTMWRGNNVVGVLDRMMDGTDDSLYPYTRAALMGYTGSHEMCESLYPHCPTSIDEMIETFNNLRKHFPNGIPFRDRIPAPLRYLIP